MTPEQIAKNDAIEGCALFHEAMALHVRLTNFFWKREHDWHIESACRLRGLKHKDQK